MQGLGILQTGRESEPCVRGAQREDRQEVIKINYAKYHGGENGCPGKTQVG